MNEAVFEQYKEALRRGHVAAQRGRLDLAIDAYAEAATLAPDRPVAHASLGAILVRLGRRGDALVAYDRALDLAPRDEAALAGRAEVLIHAGRRIEAAETLDLLSEIQEAGRRLADSCDSARRALEQAESRSRRRHVKDLVGRLREIGGPGAEGAMARAIEVLEPARRSSGGAETVANGQAELSGEGAPGVAVAEESAPEPGPSGAELANDALQALDAGQSGAARVGLVEAARAHARAGESDAALEACYLALSFAPEDAEIHLILVDLYLARGWHTHAVDKLALLGRMASLTGDSEVRGRVAELAKANFQDEPRLSTLYA
jgi:tetratricopeptide (TPR) repeat protein